MRIESNPSLGAELDRLVDSRLHEAANGIAAVASRLCPASGRAHGSHRKLRGTIQAEGTDVYIGWAGPGNYWPHVEYGTPPHTIRPKAKTALFWDGALHPVGVVHHPGTPEYAPMRRALRAYRMVG